MDYVLFARRLSGPAVFCVALLVLTVMISPGRVVMLGTFVAFSALAISLGLMVGLSGMLALGHAAFFGAGAYISTILNQVTGWPLPLSMAASIAVSAVLALAIGAAASARTAGLYFAVITFAFGELMVAVINNTTVISGGSEGLGVEYGLGQPMPFGFTIDRYFTLFLVLTLLLTIVVATAIRSSHFGLRLNAIRESDALARGLGFNPTSYKTAIFVVGSVLATIVGTIYAPMVGFVNPELMNVHQSIFILGLLFVGGTNSIWGAFLGVGVLTVVPRLIDLGPSVRPVVVGVAMAVVVLVDPDDGLAGILARAVRRALGRASGNPGPAVEEPDAGTAGHRHSAGITSVDGSVRVTSEGEA